MAAVTLHRMHGTGNRFALLDTFEHPAPADAQLAGLARSLGCSQTTRGGERVDGLLLLGPSRAAAAELRIFNADGSEAEMCGNGLRCAAAYLFDRGRIRGRDFVIQTLAGSREVTVLESAAGRAVVRVSLGVPIFEAVRIPTTLSVKPHGVPLVLSLDGSGETVTLHCVSMGNPHAVLLVGDVDGARVSQLGPAIERHAAFPRRTNVGFLQIVSRGELRLRVWERGVGETAACGTGAAAALVAAVRAGLADRDATVHLPGGNLRLYWPADDAAVSLTGEVVLDGHVAWPLGMTRRSA